jgi:hypothetical protein
MAIFNSGQSKNNSVKSVVWARPEMQLTFRAEIMPGKSREERTFASAPCCPNGRVTLHNFPDEHREGEFEPMNFKRNLTK